jgi:hypothetical protein
VEEGVTGFVVYSVDEMAARARSIVTDGFDRHRCRGAASARFGAERMVSAYLGVYSAAVAGRVARVEAP